MKNLFSALFIFSVTTTIAQTISWEKTRAWKLYDLHDKKGFRVPADSLSLYKSINLNDDSVKFFLIGAIEIPYGDKPVWMGAFIASCIDSSGIEIKIDISNYGGFFYDEKKKKYFQLKDELKDKWMVYLTAKGEEMLKN